MKTWKQGTPVSCNGYQGTIVRHYDGAIYELRLPGGVCATSEFEVIPTGDFWTRNLDARRP